jgi:general stress protein 26
MEDPMLHELLAGAAKTMAGVRYCWLVTTDATGAVHGRPMGRILPEAGEERLTVRFLADDRSRKVAEIRHAAAVTAIFENQAEEGYVTVAGRAILQDDAAVVRRQWKPGYNAYFASEADRAHALFIDVAIERLELWIRGVTPEPFGVRPTVLEQGEDGWRLARS